MHYIVAKEADRTAANTAVTDLLQILTVVALVADDFHHALAMRLRDFEDAVQAAACLSVGADYIVTRNGKDYKGAPVTTRTPGEVVASLM